ncbi:DUF5658 family protein [Haloferacaceae archaeon DSL9]
MELSPAEIQWWVAALLFYGVGDYVTTVVAVRVDGIVEANPVVTLLLSERPSPLGFAALKLAALSICFFGFYSISGTALAIFIPITIALLGAVVTVSNLRTLARG